LNFLAAPTDALVSIDDGQIARLRRDFEAASPFKHVVIDGFFDSEVASALLRDFPPFEAARAMNEFGQVGGKAVNSRIEEISPTYAALSNYLKSKRFLALMSAITGIADLLPDPNMYGGGTHENLHGQELDPHIDFNYDPPTKLHRRLNLLVYLNPEWREEWGGAIELHSNPRTPDTNVITAFAPSFNRALVFETNERSWHGFPRINLPPAQRCLSRKSLSVYLYTRTRPEQEIVPEHGTFYVQRPLPPHLRPGHVLTAEDISEMKSLLTRRDGWLEHYQNAELKMSALCGQLEERIRQRQRGVGATLARNLRRLLRR
jgi:Rps23 Pro-64 3,4-dihydroxylase Tpa1-like proline 4-hydroxylase